MSSIRKRWRLPAVAVCCVAIGAGVSAIASAGAATSTTGTGTGPGHPAANRPGIRAEGLRRIARAVQGSAVVHTHDGFATITFERGRVAAVSGNQLTIAESTRTATYKTVTVAIPANAVVRDDRREATLSDLTVGQRVVVVRAPKRTYVIAHAPRTP